MENGGPLRKIVFIDDESYEAELLKFSFAKLNLNYDIIYFSQSAGAYEYLEKTSDLIFMVMSDVDLPGMTGLQLKKKIDSSKALVKKAFPSFFTAPP